MSGLIVLSKENHWRFSCTSPQGKNDKFPSTQTHTAHEGRAAASPFTKISTPINKTMCPIMQYSNLVSVSSVKGVAVSQMEELETREIGWLASGSLWALSVSQMLVCFTLIHLIVLNINGIYVVLWLLKHGPLHTVCCKKDLRKISKIQLPSWKCCCHSSCVDWPANCYKPDSQTSSSLCKAYWKFIVYESILCIVLIIILPPN